MNIVLFESQEIVGNTVFLEGRRAQHIVKVLRAKPGDNVRVGCINGKMGCGVIKNSNPRQPYSVVLEISLKQSPEPTPQIDIILALPRPVMFKRILRHATALGIGRLYVVNANRVEKSFWDASVMQESFYRKHLIRGLEQAVDTRLPTISFHKGFKPFVESTLPIMSSGYRNLLLAHPDVKSTLSVIFSNQSGRTLLAVGPEGGWVDYERARMQEAGFSMFSIGPRILDVETAVAALHGMVSLLSSATRN